MKVLITGGTGLLGKALLDGRDELCEVVATYVGDYEMQDTEQIKYIRLDIRDKDGYRKLFGDFKPDVAIHTAGIGSPDYAEVNRDLVLDVNFNGTANIIQMCEDFSSKFIYISSNGIYDGDNAPYSEEDKAKPVNYYGVVKLMGEDITKKAKVSYAIIRPILMYGWPYPFERANIVTLAISKLKEGKRVHAYDDVCTNPLLSNSCATAIWKMIDKDAFDIFNIAGADRVSVFELLTSAAEVFGLDRGMISPVRQGYFNELAKRPTDTSLKTDKMQSVLGLAPLRLRDGLAAMRGVHL
jgi:dTDP-4-dehydrorhamnose reductase